MPDAITLLNMVAATKGAYYRGMYNGIKGIWDGGKMLVTETDKVLEGIYQSGSEFLEAPLKNTWEFLGDIKDGFIDSVWRSTPQEIAEDAGELAFDVAISVPTGGAGKVVSGAAKGIGKIKYLDNLVDIGKISQKIPSLQGMPLPAGGGFFNPNLADDFLKAPYQMIKPDGEDVAKLTAMGDDVAKQGAKEVKKPDTIDSQKVIKEKSGKETESGVQITDSVNKTEVKDIVEKIEVKDIADIAEEPKVKDVKKKIDDENGSGSADDARNSHVEIIDSDRGTFIIKDWSKYPDDYVPLPNKNKEWRLLEGDEYELARRQANEANKNIRNGDNYYSDNRLEIHEIEPVKFGGSPIDLDNKTAIQGRVHRKYVTPWWNKIRNEVKKGLNK